MNQRICLLAFEPIIRVSLDIYIDNYVCLVSLPIYVGGACDYTSLTTSLNSCMATASGTTNTRWMFPFGTISQQATFCSSAVQTNLSTCITAIFGACTTDAKSLRMFSTTGSNLISAYSALCSNSLITEAQACMSVISSISTYTTAETAFASSVTALHSSATNLEICGLATTLEYTAFTQLLSVTCITSSHLAVWTSFYNTVLDTFLCTLCSSTNQNAHCSLLGAAMLFVYRLVIYKLNRL